MLQLSVDSEEYIRVRVTANEGSTHNIDPTSDTVDMAVTTDTPAGVDWQDATWETDSSVSPTRYYIRALASAFDLSADTHYSVWVRIFDVPETVIRNAGPIFSY